MNESSPERKVQQERALRSVTVIARLVAYLALIWIVIDLVLLALGFTLKLFGANPEAGFTDFVYRSLDRTMEPFRGIFPGSTVGTTSAEVEAIVDTSILFAMLVYGIVFIGVRAATTWLDHRLRTADARLERAKFEFEADRRRAEAALQVPYGEDGQVLAPHPPRQFDEYTN